MNKKRSKPKFRTAIVLSLIVVLAISTVSFILLRVLGTANNNGSPSPNNTPGQTSPDQPTTPSQTYQIKVLNKQIPAGYTMGFPVDGGLINGMNVLFIQNSNEKVSIRFTAKMSGTVTGLVVNAFAFEGQPTVRVGMQEDNGGNPVGGWINQNAFGDIQLSSSNGFKTVQLGAAVGLTKGQVYHIVIEASPNSWSGTAAVTTYQANGFAQPQNPDDPDIVWNDQEMSSLSFDGASWRDENKWPIFVVKYSDGELEGQPYSLLAQWVVWGTTYVGETINPASDYKLGKIAFDVSLGSLTAPQDDLYYQVRDFSDNVLAEGVFAERGRLTASQTWIEVTLPAAITLKAGSLYRVVVRSPNTDLANAYYLYGHEFSFDPTIGYGSLQHQITSSLSAGQAWGDNSDADAVFKITTAG